MGPPYGGPLLDTVSLNILYYSRKLYKLSGSIQYLKELKILLSYSLRIRSSNRGSISNLICISVVGD
jgi:hypothetical protein